MSSDTDSEAPPLVQNLRAEIFETAWGDHLQTMLVATGMLLFGVAIGVRWAAVGTLNAILSADGGVSSRSAVWLAPIYNSRMRTALIAAAVCLIAGVILEQWGRKQ